MRLGAKLHRCLILAALLQGTGTSEAGQLALDTPTEFVHRSLDDFILVSTADGVLHAHNIHQCSFQWKYDVVPGFISSAGGQAPAQLFPALDGSVFVLGGDGSAQMLRGIRVPDIVNDAPFTTPAFPGIYFTGHKASKVHSLDLNSLKASHSNEERPVCNEVAEDSSPEASCNVVTQSVNAERLENTKIVFSEVTWRVGALDAERHVPLWGFNFTELMPMRSKPQPVEIAPVWKDQLSVSANSVQVQDCDFSFQSHVQAIYSLMEVPFQQTRQYTLQLVTHALPAVLGTPQQAWPNQQLSLPAPQNSQASNWAITNGPLVRQRDALDAGFLCLHDGVADPSCATQYHLLLEAPDLQVTNSATTRAHLEDIIPPLEPPTSIFHLVAVTVAATLLVAFICVLIAFRKSETIWKIHNTLHKKVSTLSQEAEIGLRAEIAGLLPAPSADEDAAAPSSAASSPILTMTQPPDAVQAIVSRSSAFDSVQVPSESRLAANLSNGHFQQKFNKVEMIGQGGFGVVFRATHNLENTEYAVKLVPVEFMADEEVSNSRDFREITSMIHFRGSKHVVRYLTCWIEEPQFLPLTPATPSRGPAAPPHLDMIPGELGVQSPTDSGRERSGTDESALASQRFQHQDPHSNSGSDVGSLNSTGTSSSMGFEWVPNSKASEVKEVQVHSAGVQAQAEASAQAPRRGRSGSISDGQPLYPVVLAIQMELVSGVTLRQWLDNPSRSRVPGDWTRQGPLLCVEIELGRQMLKAMKDIHSSQIIHRDLKPTNIFVSSGSPLVLKIGDFGLARSFSADASSLPATPQGGLTAKDGSGCVGTPGYMAPEGSAKSSDKSDVFVAALILLELLCPRVETAMERQRLLDGFRQNGELPTHLSPKRKLAAFGKLLLQMQNARPEDRPNAGEAYKAWLNATTAAVPAIREEEDPDALSDSSGETAVPRHQ